MSLSLVDIDLWCLSDLGAVVQSSSVADTLRHVVMISGVMLSSAISMASSVRIDGVLALGSSFR